MVETTTKNYGWVKPEITKSPSTWGGFLNNDLDAIDALVFANQQAIVPIGSITMFGGATAPTNWLLCQGQTLDIGVNPQYTALKNLIGYAFGGSGNQFKLPNLGAQFPIGVGTNLQGVGTGLGQTGGNFLNGLAVANLPPHAHPIVDVAHNHTVNQAPHAHGIVDVAHNHGVNQWAHAHAIATGGHSHAIHTGSHNHTVPNAATFTAGAGLASGAGALLGNQTTSTAGDLGGNTDAAGNLGGNTDTQTSAISLNASGTGLSGTAAINANVSLAASGTNLSTTQNTGSGAGFNVIPPFVCLNFIIRYQ